MFESLFIYINYIIIFQFFENNSERMFYIIIACWAKLLFLIHTLWTMSMFPLYRSFEILLCSLWLFLKNLLHLWETISLDNLYLIFFFHWNYIFHTIYILVTVFPPSSSSQFLPTTFPSGSIPFSVSSSKTHRLLRVSNKIQ